MEPTAKLPTQSLLTLPLDRPASVTPVSVGVEQRHHILNQAFDTARIAVSDLHRLAQDSTINDQTLTEIEDIRAFIGALDDQPREPGPPLGDMVAEATAPLDSLMAKAGVRETRSAAEKAIRTEVMTLINAAQRGRDVSTHFFPAGLARAFTTWAQAKPVIISSSYQTLGDATALVLVEKRGQYRLIRVELGYVDAQGNAAGGRAYNHATGRERVTGFDVGNWQTNRPNSRIVQPSSARGLQVTVSKICLKTENGGGRSFEGIDNSQRDVYREQLSSYLPINAIGARRELGDLTDTYEGSKIISFLYYVEVGVVDLSLPYFSLPRRQALRWLRGAGLQWSHRLETHSFPVSIDFYFIREDAHHLLMGFGQEQPMLRWVIADPPKVVKILR